MRWLFPVKPIEEHPTAMIFSNIKSSNIEGGSDHGDDSNLRNIDDDINFDEIYDSILKKKVT